MKIMPVHQNHEFLAVRMCELWVSVYRYLVYQCIAVYILWVQPIQFSSHLSMISMESILGSLLSEASLLSEGRYFLGSLSAGIYWLAPIFNVPRFRIMGDFPPFRVLRLWVIFRRSAFPSFRRSAFPSLHHSLF